MKFIILENYLIILQISTLFLGMHIELHYLPSIEYISLILQKEEIIFEIFENFPKQTFRNRCEILTSNGKLTLIIPQVHQHGIKTLTKDIQIDYSQNWQKQHLGAFQAAYGKSAYYEYFAPYLWNIFSKKQKFLVDLNIELLELIFKFLGSSCQFKFSSDFESKDSIYYNLIHPKVQKINVSDYSYQQCFGMEFVESLSVVDLVMNRGRDSLSILKSLNIEQNA